MTELPQYVPKQTCLDCTKFAVEQGYDGYYPGEYTPMRIGCAIQIWALDNEDDHDTFDAYMRTAENCRHFESRKP